MPAGFSRASRSTGPFYSMQRPDHLRPLGEATQDDFVFAVKWSRVSLTHMSA